MSQIYLRAWDKSKKKMLYMSDGEFSNHPIWWLETRDCDDRFILMQYIGLKDKNGKDLDWWEGDIFDDAEVLKVIVKDKGCFWFENIKNKRRIPCYQVAESDEWPHDIRKVGNATENPKLLGETDEPDT